MEYAVSRNYYYERTSNIFNINGKVLIEINCTFFLYYYYYYLYVTISKRKYLFTYHFFNTAKHMTENRVLMLAEKINCLKIGHRADA